MDIKGRATTDTAKRVVMERILTAWRRCPSQRLGQLIENACTPGDAFAVEDEALAEAVEAFAYPRAAKAGG